MRRICWLAWLENFLKHFPPKWVGFYSRHVGLPSTLVHKRCMVPVLQTQALVLPSVTDLCKGFFQRNRDEASNSLSSMHPTADFYMGSLSRGSYPHFTAWRDGKAKQNLDGSYWNAVIRLHFPNWLPNILLCEVASVLIFIFLPLLPYAHAFHEPSLFFPSPSFSLFLDLFLVFSWLLKRMTCCVRPTKVSLLRHTFLARTSPSPSSDLCTAICMMAVISSGSSHF